MDRGLNGADDSRSENCYDRMSTVSNTKQKSYRGRPTRPTLMSASTISAFGEADFEVGSTLPDWLSTVSFSRRNPLNENNEDDELGTERADDVDQYVDVAENDEDTEDDAMSTSIRCRYIEDSGDPLLLSHRTWSYSLGTVYIGLHGDR